MKILWFTNTPSGYSENIEKNNVIAGGWITEIEKRIASKPDIKLFVVFNVYQKSFKSDFNNVTYINIGNKRKKIDKLLNKFNPHHHDNNNIKQYLKIVEEIKPNLIHIWGSEREFGLISQYISIPLIIHIQGILTVYNEKWYNNKINFINTFFYDSLKNHLLKKSLFWEKKNIEKDSDREKIIFKHCKYFMGRTSWDRRVSKILSPDSKYFHCDEALRQSFYEHEWGKKSGEELNLLTTCRGNIYKGFETIIESAVLLKKSGLKFNWHVIGVERNFHTISLIKKIIRTDVDKLPIQFLGNKNEIEMIEQMLNSDMFIHPSHIDNSPNSVCEAMLLGMPVIATNAGGTDSLITNNKDGILIQDGDPFSLAGAIIELTENVKNAYALGKNARKTAREKHNRSKIIETILAIYKKIAR